MYRPISVVCARSRDDLLFPSQSMDIVPFSLYLFCSRSLYVTLSLCLPLSLYRFYHSTLLRVRSIATNTASSVVSNGLFTNFAPNP